MTARPWHGGRPWGDLQMFQSGKKAESRPPEWRFQKDPNQISRPREVRPKVSQLASVRKSK